MDWVKIEHPAVIDQKIEHAHPPGGHLLAASLDDDGSWCWGAFTNPAVDYKGQRIAGRSGFKTVEQAKQDAEYWWEHYKPPFWIVPGIDQGGEHD